MQKLLPTPRDRAREEKERERSTCILIVFVEGANISMQAECVHGRTLSPESAHARALSLRKHVENLCWFSEHINKTTSCK